MRPTGYKEPVSRFYSIMVAWYYGFSLWWFSPVLLLETDGGSVHSSNALLRNSLSTARLRALQTLHCCECSQLIEWCAACTDNSSMVLRVYYVFRVIWKGDYWVTLWMSCVTDFGNYDMCQTLSSMTSTGLFWMHICADVAGSSEYTCSTLNYDGTHIKLMHWLHVELLDAEVLITPAPCAVWKQHATRVNHAIAYVANPLLCQTLSLWNSESWVNCNYVWTILSYGGLNAAQAYSTHGLNKKWAEKCKAHNQTWDTRQQQ